MLKLSQLSLLSLLIVMFSLQNASAGEWVYVRPEIGLGFSDNVYQDDFYKKSDSYIWLQSLAVYDLDNSSLVGNLNLRLFSKEDANNSVSYALKHKSKLQYEDLGLVVGLGGFNYFKSSVGSTDEAFTNFYLTTYVTKNYKVNSDFEINFEPGLKAAFYPQLANRNDLITFFRIDSTWRVHPDIEVSPYVELGFLFSNQNYYTKNYMDLGVAYNEKINELYKYNIDLLLRNNSYPNRRVSEILEVPNRAGRVTSMSIDTSESIGLTQISFTFTRTDLDRELSLGISHTNESSLSELEHYQESQLLASAAWTF